MAWDLGVFSNEPNLCRRDPGTGSSTGGTGRVGSWERHVGAVLLVWSVGRKTRPSPDRFLIHRS